MHADTHAHMPAHLQTQISMFALCDVGTIYALETFMSKWLKHACKLVRSQAHTHTHTTTHTHTYTHTQCTTHIRADTIA
jgi:hypothetical protein